MSDDLLDPARLTGLDLPPERLREVAEAFSAIRLEIEKLRALDLQETHPAVVYRPVARGAPDERETLDERETPNERETIDG